MKDNKHIHYLRLSSLVVSFGGLAAVGSLILGDHKLYLLFPALTYKYQFVSGAMLFLLVFGVFCGIGITYLSMKRVNIFQGYIDQLTHWLGKPNHLGRTLVILIVFILINLQMYFQVNWAEDTLHHKFLTMLQSEFLWLALVGLLTAGLVLIFSGDAASLKNPVTWRYLIICILIIGIAIWLGSTDYGYHQSAKFLGRFRPTGYPLLGYQLGFSVGIVILFNFLRRYLGKYVPPKYWDIGILVVIIVGAFLLWRGVPVESNGFVDAPRPPNQEIYPALDAELYDRSALNFLLTGKYQTYLVDDFWKMHVLRRPVLILYLAALHRIGGIEYSAVLPYQLALFTLLPVLIYLIGRELHSRSAGLLAAGMMVFRQSNGMTLGAEVTGSNLHMLLSDIPATIGGLLFTYLVIRWLKSKERSNLLLLLAGGVLGLTMLIRMEVLVFLLAAIAIILVYQNEIGASKLAGLVSILLGMIVILLPWITRNYLQTNQIFIESPGDNLYQIQDILSKPTNDLDQGFQYRDEEVQGDIQGGHGASFLGVHDPDWIWIRSIADGSSFPFILKTNLSFSTTIQITTSVERPGTLEIFLNHIGNSIRQSVLYLPTTPLGLDLDFQSRALNDDLKTTYGGFFYPPETLISLLPYWMIDWDGVVQPRSWVFLGALLGLMAWGAARIWQQRSWLMALPILIFLGYIFTYALFTRSGGRWLIEADWVTALFYSAGIIEIVQLFSRDKDYVEAQDPWDSHDPRGKKRPYLFMILLIGLLAAGITIPLLERLMNGQHLSLNEIDSTPRSVLRNDFEFLDDGQQDKITTFLENGGEIFGGYALYPRFYEPGKQVVDSVVKYYENRTTFYLAGDYLQFMVLNNPVPPNKFPHGSQVIVLGCPGDKFRNLEGEVCLGCQNTGVDTLAVILLGENGQYEDIIWRSGILGQKSGCPLPKIE